MLDLEEVEARPSSEGLECRRCSMSNLTLFGALSDKESLRARFLSPPVLCCARAVRTFFSKSLRNAHLMFMTLSPVPALG